MPISGKISSFMKQASWIRRMFEEGEELKRKIGRENVFDFTLGNPILEPPTKFKEVLIQLLEDSTKGRHGYMPNAGFPEVRETIASYISAECGVELSGRYVVMACGAGGALNVTLKSILDTGSEVIILTPYFVEYIFYVDHQGGKVVPVETKEDFHLDITAIEKALTSTTRAIILNSPNNPTGVVYSKPELEELANLLTDWEKKGGQPIYIISDEPYRKLVYDGVNIPSIVQIYPHSIFITSHSKDLSLAGERIGYAVVNPTANDAEQLINAMIFCTRTLGFVNAPALMQRAVAKLLDTTIDVNWYKERRDLLYQGLVDAGYEVRKPQGAFYLFPRSPVEDEMLLIDAARRHRILFVPGRGFGRPGYVRLAYCVSLGTIERALPGLAAIRQEVRDMMRKK